MTFMTEAALAEGRATDRPRRRRRTWLFIFIALVILAGGLFRMLKVERDPRLLGDWYSPGGVLFRFRADGTVQRFLPTANDLALWSTNFWHTEGDVVRMASRGRAWKDRWNELVETVRPSGIQFVRLRPSDYRIVEWGSSTVTLQRLSRNATRSVPQEIFTRTPPVLPPTGGSGGL